MRVAKADRSYCGSEFQARAGACTCDAGPDIVLSPELEVFSFAAKKEISRNRIVDTQADVESIQPFAVVDVGLGPVAADRCRPQA